jgi:hypothetical protein
MHAGSLSPLRYVAKNIMKETILKKFFEGKVSEDDLLSDLSNSVSTSGDVTHFRIDDMNSKFTVLSSHLIKVCNSFLSDKLQPEDLKAIGFCLEASDSFQWDAESEDGRRVADIVFFLSSPEINYELNKSNILLFKKLLIHGGTPNTQAT